MTCWAHAADPVLLGCSSERRWLRRAGPLVALAIADPAAHSPSWGDQLRLVDSKLGECEVVAGLLDHGRHRLRPGLVILADKGVRRPPVRTAGRRPWRQPAAP